MFKQQIESLRGYAAISVVIGHAFAVQGDYPLVRVLFNENSAVILFFVMSGYVLGMQLDGLRGSLGERYKNFAVRRFFRIAPALWVMTPFAFATGILIGENHGYGEIWKTMLFQSKELNGPLWTIMVEMWCSLAFPLIYFVRGRFANAALFSALACLSFTTLPEWTRYLVYFQLGLFVPASATMLQRAGAIRYAILAAAIALYALGPVFLPVAFWLRTSGLASLLILAFVTESGFPRMRFLGRISYSLYLVHFPLIFMVGAAFGGETLATHLLVCAIAIPLSVAVAYVLHVYVEAPMNDFGKLIVRQRLDSSHQNL